MNGSLYTIPGGLFRVEEETSLFFSLFYDIWKSVYEKDSREWAILTRRQAYSFSPSKIEAISEILYRDCKEAISFFGIEECLKEVSHEVNDFVRELNHYNGAVETIEDKDKDSFFKPFIGFLTESMIIILLKKTIDHEAPGLVEEFLKLQKVYREDK